MKNRIPKSVSKYMASIGSKGGKNGSKADKKKAANARWKKVENKV